MLSKKKRVLITIAEKQFYDRDIKKMKRTIYANGKVCIVVVNI